MAIMSSWKEVCWFRTVRYIEEIVCLLLLLLYQIGRTSVVFRPLNHLGRTSVVFRPLNHLGRYVVFRPLNHLGRTYVVFRPLNHLGRTSVVFRRLNHLGRSSVVFRPLNHLGRKFCCVLTIESYYDKAPEFTPNFSGVRVARSLVFCVVFCRSLFVLISPFLIIVLSVLLRSTDFDYPFVFFKLFLHFIFLILLHLHKNYFEPITPTFWYCLDLSGWYYLVNTPRTVIM